MSKPEPDCIARVEPWVYEGRPVWRLRVRLPALPPTNASDDAGWHKRSKTVGQLRKAFAKLVPRAMRPQGAPLSQAAVVVTRWSSVRPDYDGLVYSGKYIIDLLHSRVGALPPILKDDRHENIGVPDYQWRAALPGRGFMELIVLDRPPWEWERR